MAILKCFHRYFMYTQSIIRNTVLSSYFFKSSVDDCLIHTRLTLYFMGLFMRGTFILWARALKKWIFDSDGWTKHKINFYSPQGIYSLEKHDEPSESAAFGLKFRYFTDQNGSKGGSKENEFWVFLNSEMNVTNSWSRKRRWKKWGHLSSFRLPFLSYRP